LISGFFARYAIALINSRIEYVLVAKEDIELALQIGRDVFIRNLDDLTPPGRTLLGHIIQMLSEGQLEYVRTHPKDKEPPTIFHIPFTRKRLRDRIAWSEAQVRQNIAPLVELGYLAILAGKNGSAYRYILLDDGSTDPKISI